MCITKKASSFNIALDKNDMFELHCLRYTVRTGCKDDLTEGEKLRKAAFDARVRAITKQDIRVAPRRGDIVTHGSLL